MLYFQSPIFETVQSALDYDYEELEKDPTLNEVHLLDLQQPVLEIWESGDSDNVFQTVELNRDSRQYIRVRMSNVIETFETNKNDGDSRKISSKKTVPYELERCSESLFNKTQFEKQFFNNLVKDNFVYCVHDNNAFLKGTRNDQILEHNYAMFIYEIERCHENLRNKDKLNPLCKDEEGAETCDRVDPPCAKESQIDKWLSHKKAMYRVINNKMAFKNFTQFTRQNDLML